MKIDGEITTYRFVVHEHYATTHHFDFRLEMDGVLRSWVVPKGVPEEIGIKRLAILVEDHLLDYIDFEGEIEDGNYGAGKVNIWDKGLYTLDSKQDEKLVFHLSGEKLTGKYVLLKTKGYQPNSWLIFKAKSE